MTNYATQNNTLVRVLAPNTDALILASATPHNGGAQPSRSRSLRREQRGP